MLKVYVAGKFSDTNVVDVLKNIGRGEEVAADLFQRGFYPFVPWHDKDFVLRRPESEFTVQQFYDYSMAWLDVSDVVFLVEGWEASKGTLKEIERAKQLNIPVVKSISELESIELIEYNKRKEVNDA